MVAIAAAGLAVAETAPQPKGYLEPGDLPHAEAFLPPPPAAGSPREAADREVYRATRSLRDTGRWALAQEDADLDPRGAGRLFDCALGARLEQDQPPALTRLLTRTLTDVLASFSAAKDLYRRPRPFVAEDGPICVDKDKQLTTSFSYPSGHAAVSWAWGLVLAEIEPDRADAILKRAEAIGESRVVCGVHYPSDITAGRLAGAAVVAAEHRSADFHSDLAAAKAEIDARRAQGLGNPVCTAEADALERAAY
jgi:acid phosphatase (class A)